MAQFALADELGDFLGRPFTVAEEAQADLLLQLASAAIQSEAHQSFEAVTDDEVVLSGNHSTDLWLPERPVIDVTEIIIRNGVGLPVNLAIEPLQYSWNRLGLLRRGPWSWLPLANGPEGPWGGWGGPRATVAVTYSHGYEQIPDNIRGVCLSVAARALANPEGVGIASESVDGAIAVSYTPGQAVGALDLTESEAKIARRYRPVNA